MKLGILLFVIGSILSIYLAKIKFKKRVLKNIGIAFGIVLALYGLILFLQPNEDTYIKFTKTTVSDETKLKQGN